MYFLRGRPKNRSKTRPHRSGTAPGGRRLPLPAFGGAMSPRDIRGYGPRRAPAPVPRRESPAMLASTPLRSLGPRARSRRWRACICRLPQNTPSVLMRSETSMLSVRRMNYERRMATASPRARRLVIPGCASRPSRREWPCRRIRVADRGLREGILISMMSEDRVWKRGRPPRGRRGGSNAG